MVHNGIEYGMMQSFAEGFEILQRVRVRARPAAGRGALAHGSVVRSWLLELLERALADDPASRRSAATSRTRARAAGPSSSAINEDVPAPVITLSLFARFASRQDESFAAKVNAALRNQFGGHAVKLVEGGDR